VSGRIGVNGIWRDDLRVVDPTPAADPEYERDNPIKREDRQEMLRSYFRTRGLTEDEIDAALRNAKV
jgi:hypothetical protein